MAEWSDCLGASDSPCKDSNITIERICASRLDSSLHYRTNFSTTADVNPFIEISTYWVLQVYLRWYSFNVRGTFRETKRMSSRKPVQNSHIDNRIVTVLTRFLASTGNLSLRHPGTTRGTQWLRFRASLLTVYGLRGQNLR